MSTGRAARRASWCAPWVLALAAVAWLGCRQDMQDQPRVDPLEASTFFADGMGARPVPEGTVARGSLQDDPRFYRGVDDAGQPIDELPVELTRELVERGRQRYEIFCSLCHGASGDGRGMIVRRGFKQPPPLWQDRLQAMPAGYFFDVITNGYGVMSSYSRQVPVEDRWAIVAYVRALQIAGGSRADEMTADQLREHQAGLAAAAAPAADDHGGHAADTAHSEESPVS